MARTTFTRLTVASLALALAACSGGDDDGTNNVKINSFSATPTTVASGATTNLAWSTSNATNIKITANPGGELVTSADATGTAVSAALTQNTSFTLTAEGPGGPLTNTVMVTIQGNNDMPMISSFAATPATIVVGGMATLMWTTVNADSVSITAGGVAVLDSGPANGSQVVMPAGTTTYELTATGANGTATRMTMVTVTIDPIISAFTAAPNTIDPGDSATLAWTVVNADNVTITDSAGGEIYNGANLNDSATVMPTATEVYTLVASNAVGTDATEMRMVTVNAPTGPTISVFNANPTTVNLGEPVTLSWTTANATSITIDDGAGTSTTTTDLMGTWVVRPPANRTYTLTASDGVNPDATAMAPVSVLAAAPAIISFVATPNPAALNGQTTISFDIVGADSVRVLRAGTEIYTGTIGIDTLMVTLTDLSTMFTIEATNTIGTSMMMLDVGAHAAPTINDFTVTPPSFQGTVTATLSYDVSSTSLLELYVNGTLDTGFAGVGTGTVALDTTGSYGVVVSATTEFRLVATSAGGSAQQTVVVSQLIGEVEPNNDLATANVVPAVGGAIQAMIGVAGDRDWYAVTVPQGYSIRAETSDGLGGCTMDTTLTLTATSSILPADRIAFNDDGGNGACSLINPLGGDTAATNLAAGTYYLVVTEFGDNGTGDYVLDVQFIAPACGDTLRQTGEFCDDGNTTAGDGCDALCQPEIVNTFIATAGSTQAFAMNALAVGEVQYFTVQVPAGPDVYLEVETFEDIGAMTCANIDTVLRLYDDTGVQVGTDDEGGIGSCSMFGPATDAFARLTGGATYFVRVEDYLLNTAITNYDVDFAAYAADVCGNGFIEGTELCDDGNTVANDGCDALCAPEPVGTFTAIAGTTQTFATNAIAIGERHWFGITVPAGNDVYLRAETFEDAAVMTCATADTFMRLFDNASMQLGTDDLDGVGNCSLIVPTDAFARLTGGATYLLSVEEDFNNDAIANYDLVMAGVATDVCGNGVVETNEDCDDGNTVGGDACPATCAFANLLTGTSAPNVALPDNDPVGITDTITIPATPACTIMSVSLDVDFTHTYRGDIVLDLTSPGGTTVRVKEQAFENVVNLVGNYPNDFTPANPLTFAGAGNGVWTLVAADDFAGDTGTLNSWGINVACQ